MKRIISLLIAAGFYAIGLGQQINDPNAELRTAGGYHGIDVGDAFDVYISQSNEEAVAVSASEIKHRDRIKVEVKNGILWIRYDRDMKLSLGSDKRKLKAYISVKQLDKLNISGACDVFINGALKAEVLTIHQSGASDLKGQLDVGKLTVDLSGASDMIVTGRATQVSIEASGASKFKGYDLISDFCIVEASGASDIKITVNRELSADAGGASEIRYRGSGVIREIKSSSASRVTKG